MSTVLFCLAFGIVIGFAAGYSLAYNRFVEDEFTKEVIEGVGE